MKTIFALSALLVMTLSVHAQRLAIGERAPEVKVTSWLGASVATSGKPLFVDFFHSSNDQCVKSLAKVDELNKKFSGRLNVVVLNKEGDKVAPIMKNYGFASGYDEGGKTFTAYDVRYVPFSALIDSRGRLVWTGNVNTLTDDIVEKALR